MLLVSLLLLAPYNRTPECLREAIIVFSIPFFVKNCPCVTRSNSGSGNINISGKGNPLIFLDSYWLIHRHFYAKDEHQKLKEKLTHAAVLFDSKFGVICKLSDFKSFLSHLFQSSTVNGRITKKGGKSFE